MKLYRTLFYLLYRNLRAIEAGFTYQTDEHRAFEVAMLLSFFLWLNAIAVLPAGGNVVFVIIGLTFFFVNYMMFCAGRKYKKIVDEFAKRPPGLLLDGLATIYMACSILAVVLTR